MSNRPYKGAGPAIRAALALFAVFVLAALVASCEPTPSCSNMPECQARRISRHCDLISGYNDGKYRNCLDRLLPFIQDSVAVADSVKT